MNDELRSLIAGWGAEWGLPDLADHVVVSFSTRLTRSLGRCRPSTGRITLRADLQHTVPGRLAEVLCHEVAHVAAFLRFGPRAAPHGAEWRELLSAAGFTPRVRTKEPGFTRSPSPTLLPILPYEHRCSVCQSVRYARKPVGSWRCAECLDAGMSGELVITRHQASGSSQ